MNFLTGKDRRSWPRPEEPTCGSQSVRSSKEGRKTVWSQGTQESGSVKEQITENKPATVGRTGQNLNFPKQAGDIQAPWAWVERSIWTERMLERLAQSQEQSVWFSLWDKVCNPDNLDAAILPFFGFQNCIAYFCNQTLGYDEPPK